MVICRIEVAPYLCFHGRCQVQCPEPATPGPPGGAVESEHFCGLYLCIPIGSSDPRDVSPGPIPARAAGPPADTLS